MDNRPIDCEHERFPLVSVVIPVYNVIGYLPETIRSAVNQTYKKLEIVLVDDGSTDGSQDYCDQACVLDSRITVLHQENAGLSAARNAGLRCITGEYLTFLDGDDVLTPTAIETLVAIAIESDSDIVTGSFQRITRSEDFMALKLDKAYRIMSSREALEAICFPHELNISSWGKLYRVSRMGRIAFPVGRNFEDLATIPQYIARAKKVAVCTSVVYGYLVRQGSITGTGTIDQKKYDDAACEINRLAKFLVEDGKVSRDAIEHIVAFSWLRIFRMLPMGEESYLPAGDWDRLTSFLKRESLRWRFDGRVARIERIRWLLFSISTSLYLRMFELHSRLTGLNIVQDR